MDTTAGTNKGSLQGCVTPDPREFREDVVRVERSREPGVTLEQGAADFGVRPASLTEWIRRAEAEENTESGRTSAAGSDKSESVEPAEARKPLVVREHCPREAGGCSVGMTITDAIHQAVLKIPKKAWTPAYDAAGTERPGAWVAEITGMPDLSSWPKGMRLIVRKERPHPGAQLRFTDLDGLRLTCFATNTPSGQLADLELRHRRRARCEDRIRNARDTGLRNLPLHDTAQNRLWLEIVQIALDLLAWMPMLALPAETRRWEPKRLRLRLFSAAAQLVTTGRRHWLRFTAQWPWTHVITRAIERLTALPNPG